MSDSTQARRVMVDGQVRANDVPGRRLQQAMLEVPRELFAPKSKRFLVHGDLDVEVGPGRWLLRPRDFAKLAHALDIQSSDLVLDIAGGRGYSAAVFAHLAETVVALEDDEDMVAKATQALAAAGADNAAAVFGDLKAGVPSQGPFNVIFVNGAVERAPASWAEQLADGGRLGVVVREGAVGRATVYTRAGGAVGERVVFDSSVPALPGFEAPAEFAF